MAYIVLDLEWNQAMSAQASVFNKLPIRLRGEIIQIGAVKLNKDMTPGEEFQMDVRPVYFRRMHYKVKKLTGFDKERLKNGVSFPEAMAQFRQWCGDGATFLTWGYDDKGIMEQNIIIHDLDWDWIEKWVNLQLIYNLQTGGDRNQKALSTAMEHFGIPQTRVAHDALGDAYNTALVCSRLDMAEGLASYEKNEALLSRRLPAKTGGPGAHRFPGLSLTHGGLFRAGNLPHPLPGLWCRDGKRPVGGPGRPALHDPRYLPGARQISGTAEIPQGGGGQLVRQPHRLRRRPGPGAAL